MKNITLDELVTQVIARSLNVGLLTGHESHQAADRERAELKALLLAWRLGVIHTSVPQPHQMVDTSSCYYQDPDVPGGIFCKVCGQEGEQSPVHRDDCPVLVLESLRIQVAFTTYYYDSPYRVPMTHQVLYPSWREATEDLSRRVREKDHLGTEPEVGACRILMNVNAHSAGIDVLVKRLRTAVVEAAQQHPRP